MPALPGCVTYGEDIDEAILMAIEVHTYESETENSVPKISIQYKIV